MSMGDGQHLSEEEAAAVRGLTDLAEAAELRPAPYELLVTGGRRRLLRRRRLSTAGAAAVLLAVVVGGGTALGGIGRDTAGAPAAAALPAAVPGSASVSPSGSATAATTATPTAAGRDPFTPVRVAVGKGTADGKEWQAWAALWPAGTKEQALQQAERMWAERHAAIPQLPKPVEADVLRSWRAGRDLVNLYLTVDGRRQVDDSVHESAVPSAPGPLSTGRDAGLEGTLLGFKGGEMHASPVLLAAVAPDVARVVVTWDDGSTTEPVPVGVGDSPVRWFGVAKKAGGNARSITLLGQDGGVLATDRNWMR
ncbi:hypothetical protein [Kitasatospora sp. NPDC059327]|uniref:hypothetical protein n=1 Tax=Kitasatospora sp. NPDC059327 TaxID=3346803 RepID=UPI00368F7F6D